MSACAHAECHLTSSKSDDFSCFEKRKERDVQFKVKTDINSILESVPFSDWEWNISNPASAWPALNLPSKSVKSGRVQQ